MYKVEIVGQFSSDYGHTYRVVERFDGVFVRGQGGLSESEAQEVAAEWDRDARLVARKNLPETNRCD